MKNKLKLFSFLALTFLTACSSNTEQAYCPRYALISELDRLPIATPLSPQGEIRIAQIAGKCDDNSMEIGFKATMALATNDTSVIEKEIPYFVAVVDDKQNVIHRKDFSLKVKLTGPQDVQIYKQTYKFIPNFDWRTMSILVGLNLTPGERHQNFMTKSQHEELLKADPHTQQMAKVKKISGQ